MKIHKKKLYKLFCIILKYLFLFITFGSIYILIELIFRGHSHWSMFICGGLSAMEIGMLNEIFKWNDPIWLQMLCGSFIITLNEFFTGIIVNLILKWNVWDYSDMPLNIMGQICIPFMILWFILSYFAIIIDDYLRWKYFDEEKPHYNYKLK